MQKINANITHNYFFYFFLRADKLGGKQLIINCLCSITF